MLENDGFLSDQEAPPAITAQACGEKALKNKKTKKNKKRKAAVPSVELEEMTVMEESSSVFNMDNHLPDTALPPTVQAVTVAISNLKRKVKQASKAAKKSKK